MTQKSLQLYTLIQNYLPVLKDQNLPKNVETFDVFYDWINETHEYFHYFEPKEIYGNEADVSYVLENSAVDVDALTAQTVEQIQTLIEEEDDEEDEDDYEKYEALQERSVEILFDNIKAVAEANNLTLFVIQRENPYWCVLPKQTENDKTFVALFNECFGDYDFTLSIY